MGQRGVTRRGENTMGSDPNAVGMGVLRSVGFGIREKPRTAKAGWKVGDITRGRIQQAVVAAEGVEFTAAIPGAERGVWLVTAQHADATSAAAIDSLYVTGSKSEDSRGSETAFSSVTFLGPGSSAKPVTVHVVVGSEETPFTGTVVVNISALRMGS